MDIIESEIKFRETQEKMSKYLKDYPEVTLINPSGILTPEEAKIVFGYLELKALGEVYRKKMGNRI